MVNSFCWSKCICGSGSQLIFRFHSLKSILKHFSDSRIVEQYHGFLASVLFIQIVQSVVVFSMTLIILITANKGAVYFANKLTYLIALLYEMAMFCYLGNEIYFSVRSSSCGSQFIFNDFLSLQSLTLPDRAYSCDFVNFTKRQRRILELFIHSSGGRPVMLRAEGLFTIFMNMTLFLSVKSKVELYMIHQSLFRCTFSFQIVRTTYSYVLVMNRAL